MLGNSLGAQTSMTIDSLIVVSMKPYGNQYLRPYQTQMTSTVQSKLDSLIGDFQSTLPSTAISNAVGDFILPSITPEINSMNGMNMGVNIENGWGEPRFAFVMVVSVRNGNSIRREMINGYTDKIDGYYRSHDDWILAPDTLFYINSVSMVDNRTIGGIQVPIITDSLSVLGGGMGAGHFDNQTPWKMTPSLIIENSKSVSNGLSAIPKDPSHLSVDHRTANGTPSLTYRNNNAPTDYFGRIVDSYRKVADCSISAGSDVDPAVLRESIRGSLLDPGIASVGFMQYMSSINHRYTSVFNYQALCQIDPNIDYKTQINQVEMRTTASYSEWHGRDMETQMSLVAANIVTNICIRYSLSTLDFIMTNNVMGGQSHCQITGLNAYVEGLNLSNISMGVSQLLTTELAPVISKSNEASYDLTVHYNANYEIEIWISYNGEQPIAYIYPAMCDALLSPMFTTKSDIVNKNSRDIGLVIDEVDERSRLRAAQMSANGVMGSGIYSTPSELMGNLNSQTQYQTPTVETQDNGIW